MTTNKFESFYSNVLKNLSSLKQNGSGEEFLNSLLNLYPLANKFYAKDVESLFANESVNQAIKLLQGHIRRDVLPKIESYELKDDKIVIKTRDAGIKEFPQMSPKTFLFKVFNIEETHSHYYLYLSYMLQPANYDAMQLFQKV